MTSDPATRWSMAEVRDFLRAGALAPLAAPIGRRSASVACGAAAGGRAGPPDGGHDSGAGRPSPCTAT